jgi:4-amino-4-deoxychorismate lyase
MLLLNGESRHCIKVSDRGLQYGDGVFETVDVLNSKPLFFERHLQRLALGCQTLLIPCPDFTLLKDEARQVTANVAQSVLKLIVTRGSGGRGYRQPPEISTTRLFSIHPHPAYPQEFQDVGINLRFCNKRLALNPDLARIKHLNRLEQVLARAEWQDDDIQEGLMLDIELRVVEGTMSNLFWIKAGVLHTPLLDQCGIAGIVRELVIELAQAAGISVIEDHASREDVLAADELFVTNSVIGIWPVKRLEQQRFDVGNMTRSLQSLYATRRLMDAQNV